MAPLFPHLHLTVPVLATGTKGVSTHQPACVKALASLQLGCPPQYRLCVLDCLPPTQVLSEWHSLEVITPCNKFRLGVIRINYHLTIPNSAGEMDDFFSTQWESTSVRHAFIRKVYLILSAQLAVTFSVVAVFTFVDPVRMFVIQYPGIYWASFVVYFVVYCILICCKEPRRRFPWNLVLLGVFTLALSYMAGAISSYYETKAVFIAMGVTALVCVAVTVFCFQTKVDFTSCGGFICIAAVLLMIIGIVTAIVLSFQYVPWLHMLYAAIGAIVYTLFLTYNTQLLIGNRELAISPEEYVYGALSLYVDIVHIFLFILQVSGAATE
ncbi:protein lifeguard 3-like isoform X1 [Archocentrus centrarchus]|uniref:protein lifeguard 3-like isoform X1 n=1 Tax=Archocentrus centrarchus TaxID=63155 RepID=UPI0011E9C966|nr:protein lifeguard 3-like isoform X1 [Archocentrus centrarchus]